MFFGTTGILTSKLIEIDFNAIKVIDEQNEMVYNSTKQLATIKLWNQKNNLSRKAFCLRISSIAFLFSFSSSIDAAAVISADFPYFLHNVDTASRNDFGSCIKFNKPVNSFCILNKQKTMKTNYLLLLSSRSKVLWAQMKTNETFLLLLLQIAQ